MNVPILLAGLAEASALVLALWLVFRFAPRIAPDTRAWLWRICIVKLALSAIAIGHVNLQVLPAVTPAPASQLPPSTLPIPAQAPTPLPASGNEIEWSAAPLLVAPLSTPAVQTPVPRSPQLAPLASELLAAWALGLVLCCLRALLEALRARRWRRQLIPITDDGILECLRSLSDKAGLRQTPRLACSEAAAGPMVYGIWRPIIVLPTRLIDVQGEDIRLALAHEIAHIRRQDVAWAAFAWLARSVLFFNPAVWLAERELRAAQESATDQEAVWIAGASLSAYGEMLLRAMSPDRVAWYPAGLAMFDSFRNAQRRLRAMKHFSVRPTSLRKALTAASVAIGLGCLPTYLLIPATAAAAAHPAKPKSPAKHSVKPRKSRVKRRLPATLAASTPRKTVLVAPVPTLERKLATEEKKMAVHSLVAVAPAAPQPPAITKTISVHSTPNPEPPVEQPVFDTTRLLQSEPLKSAAKEAQDEFGQQVAKLIAEQNERIAEYRRGSDQRELEAEEREREAQQRKREGEERARGVLLREQVIEAHERDSYKVFAPDQDAQREADRRQREAAARQTDADQVQLVLDQKQRETDRWQKDFDEKSIAAMRTETETQIAAARSRYQARIQDLIAGEVSKRRELSDAAAYPTAEARTVGRFGASMHHFVKTASGLGFSIPDGYEITRVNPAGKDTYTVIIRRKQN